ncbi:acyltransferase [Paraburkholderia phymatum]|uniref:acyltransferase family protein n=1 Tax=Paraburkholderia phymatum TaxID=148447 RepID=UPI003180E579
MDQHLANLDVHEAWRIVPVLVVLFAAISLLRWRGLDAQEIRADERSRNIDGLRGFLALGVFLAHASGYYTYMRTGFWGPGPDLFFNQLGNIGVSVFFVITSYLFWGKAIAASARVHRAADYRRYLFSLYLSRFFRVAPLFYFVLCLTLLIVFSATGPHLNVSPAKLAKEIANWMALGLGANVWINASPEPPVMFGMVWTLAWEWYFYFSLAVTSLIAFVPRLRTAFVVLIFGVSAAFSVDARFGVWSYLMLFSIGMTAATLPRISFRLDGIPTYVRSLGASALIALAYAGVGASNAMVQNLLIAAFFYLVLTGCDLFGLLKSRGAQRLGAISYGIYLTHGVCLHLVFGNASLRQFSTGSITQYWTVVLIAGALVVAMSCATYVMIERPGIALGRALLARRGWKEKTPQSGTDAQTAAAT